MYLNISGEDECEVPPVPIPNTEVKLDIADDSWGSPPVKIGFRQFFYQEDILKGCFFVAHIFNYVDRQLDL